MEEWKSMLNIQIMKENLYLFQGQIKVQAKLVRFGPVQEYYFPFFKHSLLVILGWLAQLQQQVRGCASPRYSCNLEHA